MSAAGMEELIANDGHRLRAHVATPDGDKTMGGIVLLHEIFGINHYMRDMATIFAQHGYLAIVPDLFARQERDVELGYIGEDFDHAIGLRDGLDWNTVVLDIAAAAEHLRAHRRSNRRVAALGYCLGGGLAIKAAAEAPVDAAISYYGVGVQDRLDLAPHISVPLLFHFAENDHYCLPEARSAIEAAFARHAEVAFHLYPGVGHAFATYGRDTFEATSTDLAFTRTIEMLEGWISR
jgi:carboxymethylenebutenolidase